MTRSTRKTRIKSIDTENGTIYVVRNGLRSVIARSDITIHVYENATTIPVLGKGYDVKRRYVTIAVSSDAEYTREVDEEYLRSISQFDITAEIERPDGVFERLILNNVLPIEINLDGDWIFELPHMPKTLAVLLNT